MALQGIGRTEPPFCHGNGDDHCCYVDGQVCPHLSENDPRATDGRRWSCGLLLTVQEQFPRHDMTRLWERVRRHPLFEQIAQVWAARGVTFCGDFLGGIVRDEQGNPLHVVGQCCFEGYTFDLQGNVLSGPGG